MGAGCTERINIYQRSPLIGYESDRKRTFCFRLRTSRAFIVDTFRKSFFRLRTFLEAPGYLLSILRNSTCQLGIVLSSRVVWVVAV